MSNTQSNIGIRRMITSLATPAYRNFEPQGGQLYKCNRPLEYAGTQYADGATIPFDAGGPPADRYSDDALMERFFNAAMIDPAT